MKRQLAWWLIIARSKGIITKPYTELPKDHGYLFTTRDHEAQYLSGQSVTSSAKCHAILNSSHPVRSFVACSPPFICSVAWLWYLHCTFTQAGPLRWDNQRRSSLGMSLSFLYLLYFINRMHQCAVLRKGDCVEILTQLPKHHRWRMLGSVELHPKSTALSQGIIVVDVVSVSQQRALASDF